MYFDYAKTTPSTSSSSTHSHKEEPIVASKWHAWAQEEAQQQKPDLQSPKNVHTRPPQVRAKPPTVEQQSTKPTPEQLQLVSFDPPQCFCKKEAHRGYTIEYGPILECASYGYNEQDGESYKRKYTCGFHVHEASWNKHCNDLRAGLTIQSDYPELRACPLYNFTFCSVFFTSNQHNKIPPAVLPKCFCGHPVKLREGHHQLYFTCRGVLHEGSKKCSWRLDAREVAFTKPKHRMHTFVDLNTYHQHLEKLAHQPYEKPKLPMSESPTKAQHQSDLLASLCVPKASDTMSSSSNDVISPTMSPTFSPTQFETMSPPRHDISAATRNTTLFVPTSVLAKKQPSVSCSSSTSTVSSFSTASSPSLQKAFHELEETKILNAALRAAMQRTKHDAQARIHEAETKVAQSAEKVAAIQNDYKDKTKMMKMELQQEFILRLSSQERLSSIEIDVVHLINEKERALDELEAFKESTRTKYGKEEEFNKCKVCFHRSIEYVLIPCFHFAYCQLCASKLKECALCRRSITSIEKIYTC